MIGAAVDRDRKGASMRVGGAVWRRCSGALALAVLACVTAGCPQSGFKGLAPHLEVQNATPKDSTGRTIVDFGTVPVGHTSAQSVNALNTGTSPLTLQPPSVGAPFGTDLKSAAVIGRSGQQAISFTFTPTAVGPLEQTVLLQSDGGTATVVLRATGAAADDCVFVLVPTQLAFGTGAVGVTQTASVQFANVGSVDCDVSNVRVDPSSDPSFALAPGQATSATVSFTGGSFPVAVTFSPTQAGTAFTGQVTLQVGSAGTTAVVPLTAAAVADPCGVTVQPGSLSFPPASVGQSATQTVQVFATSAAPCQLSQLRIESGSDPSFTLNAGQALTGQPTQLVGFPIAVTFLPNNPGMAAQGRIAFNAGPPDTGIEVLLSGSTVGCTYTVQPAQGNFGQVASGTSATKTFQIVATGPATCNIANLRMDPAGDPAFALSAGQPTTGVSTAAAAFTISATFAPTHTGIAPLSGTILFDSSLPTLSTRVPLTGTPAACRLPPTSDGSCPTATEAIYLSDGSSLYTFDPIAHTATPIGNLICTDGEDMEDIAIDAGGNLWAVDDEVPLPELYAVNPTNGQCTPTAMLNDPASTGLTFLGDGRMVCAGDSITIPDPTTWMIAQTIVPAGRFQTSGDVVALPDGTIYWTVAGAAGDQLVKIDSTSGATTLLATLPDSQVMLAYANGTIFGFSIVGHYLTIDPATGASTVGNLPGTWIGATTNPTTWPGH